MTGGRTPLEGRIALVAGGSGAIGAAIARALHRAGATVAVHYRTNRARAEQIAEALQGMAVGAELTRRDDVASLFAAVQSRIGPVSVLVNAAHPPGQQIASVGDLDPAELERQLDGVRSHHLLCRGALPAMRKARFGRIVLISGALMARPAEGLGAYGAAKAAATALTRFLALEEGRLGITANIVAPGRVAEPGDPEPQDPAFRALSARLQERMALPRFPSADDVAGTVVALTLPSFSPVTGQVVWVTGGEPIS